MENIIEIVALIIVVIGWWVTYVLAKRQDYQLESKKWQKQFLDKQLSEFYGQVYGILLENDRIRRTLTSQFGRSVVFREGIPLTADEKKLWLYYIENHFIPNNRKIVNLIRSNTQNLNGNSFPTVFTKFIDYAVGWELLHDQYQKLGIEYDLHFPENFPREFQKEIINIVSELKNEQWNLISENKKSK